MTGRKDLNPSLKKGQESDTLGEESSMEQNLVGSLLRALRWISPMCFSTLYHSLPLSISICYVLTPWLGQDHLKMTIPPRPYTMRQKWFPKEESGVDTEKRKNECLVGKFKRGRIRVLKTFLPLINDYLSLIDGLLKTRFSHQLWTLFFFPYLCATIKNYYSYWMPFLHIPFIKYQCSKYIWHPSYQNWWVCAPDIILLSFFSL